MTLFGTVCRRRSRGAGTTAARSSPAAKSCCASSSCPSPRFANLSTPNARPSTRYRPFIQPGSLLFFAHFHSVLCSIEGHRRPRPARPGRHVRREPHEPARRPQSGIPPRRPVLQGGPVQTRGKLTACRWLGGRGSLASFLIVGSIRNWTWRTRRRRCAPCRRDRRRCRRRTSVSCRSNRFDFLLSLSMIFRLLLLLLRLDFSSFSP